MAIGFDPGTMNLVVARRNASGEIEYKREINGFLELELSNKFMFSMFKKAGVPLIQRGDKGFALGESAVNIAVSLPQLSLRRAMKDGCLNPKEASAFPILSAMIHSILGEISEDQENLAYCIPSRSINKETDPDYHNKILKSIFEKYEINNKKVNAFSVSESLALVYSELGERELTGIACSFGAGQINVCLGILAYPILEYSVVNSGDWISEQAAKVTQESITVIDQEKMKIDLLKAPTSMVERAIQTQYHIMIEKTMRMIRDEIEKSGSKVPKDKPIPMVVAGGTSSPHGFEIIVKETIDQLNFPIKISEVIKPSEPLYSVAKGLLLCAEGSS